MVIMIQKGKEEENNVQPYIAFAVSHPAKAMKCEVRYLLGTLVVDFELRSASVKWLSKVFAHV